jgi:hypothetical protein
MCCYYGHFINDALPLLKNVRLDSNMFVKDEHSSLFCQANRVDQKSNLKELNVPSLAYKYQASVGVTDSDKHSGLLCYRINYDCKKFYRTGPRPYCYKLFI